MRWRWRPGRAVRYLPSVIAALLVAGGLAAAAERSPSPSLAPQRHAAAADGDGSTTSANGTATTRTMTAATTAPPTVPAPPPEPVVVFASADPAGTTTAFEVTLAGAVAPAPARPTVPLAQVSSALGLIVYSKTISSSSSDYQGCGVAGCSSGVITSTEAGIAFARPDRSAERLVTTGGYDIEPSFSPDGRLVAFLSHVATDDKGGTTEAVVVIDAGGARVAELAPPAGERYALPRWHPDGRAVTVLRSQLNEPAPPVVLNVPIDGGPPVEVGTGPFEAMAWSPDGTRLAVTRMRYDNDPPYPPPHPGEPTGTDLWVLTTDGRPPRQLTHMAPPGLANGLFCGSSGAVIPRVTSPSWSPDGTKIAFLSSYGHVAEFANVFDVAIVDHDGTNLRTLYAAPRTTCTRETEFGSGTTTIPQQLTLLGWSSRPR